MRKNKTPLQKEYFKQRRRLQSDIYRGRKLGYTFEENTIPKIPKKITKKSVERLSKLKPSDLYKKSYFTTETGKKIKGTTARKKHLKNVSRETYIPTFNVIDTIRKRLYEIERKTYPYLNIESRKSELIKIFEDTVTYYSEDLSGLIDYLMANEYEISSLLYTVEWESKDTNLINTSFVRLGQLLNVQNLSPSQVENLTIMNESSYDYED